MNSTTEKLLKLMRLLAWLAFLGLLIKAVAILMSYGVSVTNPEASTDLYRGMDLSRYESYSFINYTMLVIYYILMYLMQAYIALFGAKLLSNINLEKPFTKTVVDLLHKISYTILGVWLLAILHNIHVVILEKIAGITPDFIAGEFIFLAGFVYVLAQLFKKGVLLQAANELTV
ncbi:DUF2975 domain-containing protein [Kordia sp.]|uniref:DUF2975 domain-containing protein n=1 Tax=Kordia sp. TaxID=1965332 RepID=UPI003D294800